MVCINSFNSSVYASSCVKLLQSVHLELHYGSFEYSVVCAYGGCVEESIMGIAGTPVGYGDTFHVCIRKNISDHNIFHALKLLSASGLLPDEATCIVLHDTCTLKRVAFREAMKRISRLDVRGWIFGHALGLYNIGICDVRFATEFAEQWQGVENISKETSIKLEHSRNPVELECRRQVKGLRMMSNTTLAKTDGTASFENADSITLVAEADKLLGRRFGAYIAALGVHKRFSTPRAFAIPVWIPPFNPQSQGEYELISQNKYVQMFEWARALVPAQVAEIEF